MLTARCELSLSNPRQVVAALLGHYEEHGQVERTRDGGRIAVSFGQAVLAADGRHLTVELQAGDDSRLTYLKMGIVHHLDEFAGPDRPAVRWSGDGTVGRLPAFFREMRIRDAGDLTRRMRRIILEGENLQRFAEGGLHARLVFPPKGRTPSWPVIGEDGCPLWPTGEDALTARVYTIREIDLERETVTIDMLRHHDDRTPGAGFAATAGPGDVVGLMGPSGRAAPDARSLVLLGDETALPAIARILHALPQDAHARVFIDVADAHEEQPLPSSARVDLAWLHRGADEHAGGRLPEALRALGPDALTGQTHIWAGCEFDDFRAIRTYLRRDLRLGRETHHVVAYWRRGYAGDEARKEAKNA